MKAYPQYTAPILPYTGESFRKPRRIRKAKTQPKVTRIDSVKSILQTIIVSLMLAFLVILCALQIALFV